MRVTFIIYLRPRIQAVPASAVSKTRQGSVAVDQLFQVCLGTVYGPSESAFYGYSTTASLVYPTFLSFRCVILCTREMSLTLGEIETFPTDAFDLDDETGVTAGRAFRIARNAVYD